MELATQQAVLTLRECRLFAHLYACVPQFFFAALLLVAGLLPTVPACAQAQETELALDTLVTATLAADTIDNTDPEWYVEPVIPAPLRAPKRAAAAAASCTRVEAVQTFNIDSVLTEGTYYEYDAKGNVISTTVWSYSPDGTMTGKSKNEYAFDAAGTQTMTAVYIWDGAANDWKGTEKYEYVYKTFAGEKKMTSSTSSVWLNGAWVADQRFTYDYDASLREISYFEYRRNTSTNELQPVKGREQSWTDDLQTLETLYTAYANGKWTAGTKKEWAFDGNGTQTMYATYTISNGAWVGSSKETWAFSSGKQTLHEQFIGDGNNWSKTLREENEYDGANLIRVENYTYADGVATGTKKETTAYASGKKTEFVTYAWSNGAWVNATKETWAFTSGKLTLHEKSAWVNDDWSKTLREENEYSSANLIRVENYSYSNGVATGTKKEEYTYSGSQKTSFISYSWAGTDWVGASKEIWAYTSGKQTLHETYAWGATDWSITLQENTAYSGANITKIENYAWTNGTKTGTKKEEYTYSGSLKISFVTYSWAGSDWVGASKEIWAFNAANKQTLHEKYNWSDGDWVVNLREITNYDAQGNTILVENYSLTNNVWKGTKKEEYTFSGSTKTSTMTSVWDAGSNAFVYKTWSVNNTVDTPNEKCSYNWVDNAWVGTGTRTLTTKENGKEIEKINQNWPNGATDWVNRTCTTTVYSGANKTQEVYYSWLNNAWVGVKRTDYHFNADNKNDTTTAYTYSNNDWNRYSRIVNTFNASGTNIMTHTSKWQNNAWEMISIIRTDIIVDDGKQLLNAQWRCGADSIWKGVRKDTAAYSATGKKLFEAHYNSWANNDWVPTYKIEHTYDEADREVKNCRMDWNNGKWVGHYLYEYEYNDFGQQTSYTYYGDWNSSTDSWKGSSKYDYEYAPNGQYALQVMYRWQNNQWVGLFRYLYTYDAANHEIEQLVQGYSDGNWQNSQWYVHEYRGSEVVKNNEYRWRNEQWQFTRRNEKIYDNAQATLRREITGSWNTYGIVISFTDNHYFYDCDPHFYTVRFVNYDGQVLANTTAQEGETPVYSGSTPTKPADTENTYTFSGWTPALAPVTANITYTATFTAVKKTYTITWKNEDGTLIDQTTAEYGTMPTHEDASKANTAEYTYTFTGWTPGIGIVTSDAEYTATFTQTKNSYLITFQNEDGTVLSSETYEYGAMPTIPTTPTKPADGANTYTFTGWNKEVVPVKEAATYTATYNATKNSYTITFADEDGMVLQSSEVEYGAMPTAPSDPTKANTAEWSYTFAGWTPQVEAVTGDAEYIATYDSVRNSYTVTWLNEDGSVIASETLEYGATPAHADITKENTPEYTYTFAGWTPQVEAVTGNAEYTAIFDSIKNSYTITFKDEDGSVISSANVVYGAMPIEPTAPTKPADSENTYTFAGWTPTIVAVTGDAEYTATFTATKNSYTITWKNEDGSVIASETLEYGATPAHADIYKESTAEYTYIFAGWTPTIAEVTGDATYTASFTATKNKYLITFKDEDGTILKSEELEYGVTPVAPEDPTKASTAEYTYAFNGWDKEIASVTEAAIYTATYAATKNSYTITFNDEDGTTISSANVEYGAMPVEPTTPTKPTDSENTYTFAGWTPTIVAVTGDAEYTATYTTTKNSYTITWKNEDGSVIESETLEYGATPAHADIVKENTPEWTYTFAGWTPQVEAVTGNAEYTATFTATKNSYTINWLNSDNSPLAQTTVAYGESPVYTGEKPSRPTTAEYTYTFAGWDKEIVPVEGDATYTATYDSVRNSYTVTFYYEDGVTVLDQVTVQYGETPATSLIPSKYSEEHYYYTFSGWSPEVVPAEGNASYTATFKAVPKLYTVTFKNHNGRTLLTTETPYGEIPEYTGDEPTRTKDKQYTYTFSCWSPELTEVTGPTTYTAVFEGTLNQYTVIFLDEDGTELDRQTLDYGIVPVYEGETPTKDDEGQYGYTFKGWSPKLTSVTKNATYRAVYTRYDKTQGIEDVQPPCMEAQKILIGNTIYILRGGKTYTLQGVEVR